MPTSSRSRDLGGRERKRGRKGSRVRAQFNAGAEGVRIAATRVALENYSNAVFHC